ncbi:MAG: hypothetical protein QXR56_08525 [Thermofilaceae archaeon]
MESAEIRDGRLVVRSKGGEKMVLGEPTDMKWRPPRAEKWYGLLLESCKEVLRFTGWKKKGWWERWRKSKSLVEEARLRAEELLKHHEVEPLDKEIERQLEDYVKRVLNRQR